jgi:hypothetical protein
MTATQARARAERLVREYPYLFSPRTLADDLRRAGCPSGEVGMAVWRAIDAGRIVLTPEWLLAPKGEGTW